MKRHGGKSFEKMTPIEDGNNQGNQGPGVWTAVCKKLRASMNAAMFDKWIAPLRFVAEVDGSVLIVARTQFAFDRVHSEYKRDIQRVWKDVDPKERSVRLQRWADIPEDLRGLFDYPWTEDVRNKMPVQPASGEDDVVGNLMGPGMMSFDTYVTGQSNTVATKVARGIAMGRHQIPASVIVINGLQGVGKTHLMKALEAQLELNPAHKVAYISAEEFLVAYVEGATTGDTRALKARVRQADIVLFDDLQTIAGKPGTNNELAGAIRTVSERGGIVVLTSDRSPAELVGLSTGVMTVLKGAACIEIAMPDDDMRLDIVRQRAGLLSQASPNFVLDDEMCMELVGRVHGPGRDLCGAVISLYTETGLGEVPPTMEMLERVLSRQQKPVTVTMDMVKRATCKVFELSRGDLEGARKFQRFVYARQVAMYLAREMAQKSFPQIGICFGNRHHTTALYAWRKITKKLASTPELRRDIELVKQAVMHLQTSANR